MQMFFLFILSLHFTAVTPVLHTLRYFHTASSDVPNFPEFVVVGYVDDVQISHYDSNSRRTVPKQDWMNQAVDEQFWEGETYKAKNNQLRAKVNIDILKRRFNQTGGVHVVQWMSGCEWDDETGEVDGYLQFGFDGEDFLSLNLKEETWIAAKQQAFITKLKWDNNKALMSHNKYYFTHVCPEYLKKFVNAGRSSLRTELPSINLLQRTPSSPVTCHATGFYPRSAKLFWRKDREEELHEGVDHGERLPNSDGTFQMSAALNISLIKDEDWSRYDCVFQLSGVEEDLTVTLDKRVILTNWKKCDGGVVAAAVVVPVVLLLVLIGFFIWRNHCSAGFKKAPGTFLEGQMEKGGGLPEVSAKEQPSMETLDTLINNEDDTISTTSSRTTISNASSDTPLIKFCVNREKVMFQEESKGRRAGHSPPCVSFHDGSVKERELLSQPRPFPPNQPHESSDASSSSAGESEMKTETSEELKALQQTSGCD